MKSPPKPPPPARLRSVIESSRFKKDREKLAPVERWDEIQRGFDFVLARAPEVAGQPTQNPAIRAYPTNEFPGAPPLVIAYSWDEDTVTLEAVREADVGQEDD